MRPQVAAFAEAMEEKLRENDHKGGWEECRFDYLFKRLREEVAELEDAVKRRKEGWPPGKFRREAADVANFAMMIADNCKDLVGPQEGPGMPQKELHGDPGGGNDG